jgi:glyceraldehyde 3-phosphate dehydrogenase
VIGVNDDEYDPEKHIVVSNASCTTNCFVPMVKVLDDEFHIVSGLMTTVHAYTNDQNLLDLPTPTCAGPGRRSTSCRASTGAARATSLVLAAMKGRLDGYSLRVPLPAGSITDFTAVVKGNPSVAEVNAAFADGGGQAAARPYSCTPRTRWSRATSWAAPPRAPSTPG